jgi:hypothetical protein
LAARDNFIEKNMAELKELEQNRFFEIQIKKHKDDLNQK